ncbi:MAG: hypothetical protein V4574_05645 [Pseudomonadota bacterium]
MELRPTSALARRARSAATSLCATAGAAAKDRGRSADHPGTDIVMLPPVAQP